MFFTRMPVWRIVTVSPEAYSRAVDCWSAVGWLTGLVTAAVLLGCSLILPPFVAVVLAIAARTLLTGALHEDGLADFFDGMGGGTSAERILMIMKDSHIGTYGVLSLIFYYLMLFGLLSSMPPFVAALVVLAADPWSKFCASQIVNILPYCRKKEEAKNRTLYRPMTVGAFVVALVLGLLPMLPMAWFVDPMCMLAGVAALAVSMLLIFYMKHKIGGYTGDCCGATFLLSELSFYLIAAIILIN